MRRNREIQRADPLPSRSPEGLPVRGSVGACRNNTKAAPTLHLLGSFPDVMKGPAT